MGRPLTAAPGARAAPRGPAGACATRAAPRTDHTPGGSRTSGTRPLPARRAGTGPRAGARRGCDLPARPAARGVERDRVPREAARRRAVVEPARVDRLTRKQLLDRE